jgi:uncharacterized protein
MQLTSLPLFPLGTVLYPSGVLPLRVFEVRYLDMIGKCIQTGAPFGVVALTQGAEVRTPNAHETFAAVGTLATITQHEAPQPGLRVIRCVGAQRFRITRSERLKHGLWIGDVQRIGDDASVGLPEDLQQASTALQRILNSLKARGLNDDALPLQKPYQFDDCGWLANRWCELLPLQLELKQRLMELENPLVRLELVNDILDRQKLL